MDQKEIELKSRTQKKREAEELQKLGEKLVSLSKEKLKDLDLPENLQSAVLEAKNINRHEAFRRQMQHIGALMRKTDPEPIRAAIDSSSLKQYKKAQELKRIEDLRDGLIAGKNDLQRDVLDSFPEADRRHLSQLIRNARKEAEINKPPKSARVLFRYLRDLSST
ncbi:MAG: DUF615 domain-containing protein [Deltaproteobacteria bacterium]|nr:DUF615 domain-containing protein [Deltaproteobacteria bacterium]MBT6500338.1 DUF615 domain-containing protein [Deltaproteobacteria bacterium]MBT7890857.1 DUF615 domain-containing protein [Deltaproteobacteria bacterium]